MNPLFSTAEELNAHSELFHDPERSEAENEGPFLIVYDDFYHNPHEIREMALSKEFVQYAPPLPAQVGDEIASEFKDKRPAWMTSSMLRFHGREVANPKPGYRHATPDVRQKIAGIIGETVDPETWDEMGDWWNGAFHLQLHTWGTEGGYNPHIHHHFKEGDVAPRGWSGLIYLTPDAPPEVGTTIWKNKKTGLCIASKGSSFDRDLSDFELALLVENRFNRLVLFRENVLHRAEHGFGSTLETGRMTQTFFFHSERNKSEN